MRYRPVVVHTTDQRAKLVYLASQHHDPDLPRAANDSLFIGVLLSGSIGSSR